MADGLIVFDCLDSDVLAEARKQELNISREFAIYRSRLIKSAVEVGVYQNASGSNVEWHDEIITACLTKRSIPPWQELPSLTAPAFEFTRVQITNETSLGAAIRMRDQGLSPLVLNFANGTSPGGGFFRGATAQEESLCRCSALYWTLVGDPMYLHHACHFEVESTDWGIVSPQVPFICNDSGTFFDNPILIDIVTSAAPYAPKVGKPRSRELLRDRIQRILHIAAGQRYTSLVLGAWGCGAFGNDPIQTAEDFKAAIVNNFNRQFTDIVFAIADWSPQRKFLRPFYDVFSDP